MGTGNSESCPIPLVFLPLYPLFYCLDRTRRHANLFVRASYQVIRPVPHCFTPFAVERESATILQRENALYECARQLVSTLHRTENATTMNSAILPAGITTFWTWFVVALSSCCIGRAIDSR